MSFNISVACLVSSLHNCLCRSLQLLHLRLTRFASVTAGPQGSWGCGRLCEEIMDILVRLFHATPRILLLATAFSAFAQLSCGFPFPVEHRPRLRFDFNFVHRKFHSGRRASGARAPVSQMFLAGKFQKLGLMEFSVAESGC